MEAPTDVDRLEAAHGRKSAPVDGLALLDRTLADQVPDAAQSARCDHIFGEGAPIEASPDAPELPTQQSHHSAAAAAQTIALLASTEDERRTSKLH